MASALAAALLIAASVLLQPAAALGDNGTVINVCECLEECRGQAYGRNLRAPAPGGGVP